LRSVWTGVTPPMTLDRQINFAPAGEGVTKSLHQYAMSATIAASSWTACKDAIEQVGYSHSKRCTGPIIVDAPRLMCRRTSEGAQWERKMETNRFTEEQIIAAEARWLKQLQTENASALHTQYTLICARDRHRGTLSPCALPNFLAVFLHPKEGVCSQTRPNGMLASYMSLGTLRTPRAVSL